MLATLGEGERWREGGDCWCLRLWSETGLPAARGLRCSPTLAAALKEAPEGGVAGQDAGGGGGGGRTCTAEACDEACDAVGLDGTLTPEP